MTVVRIRRRERTHDEKKIRDTTASDKTEADVDATKPRIAETQER